MSSQKNLTRHRRWFMLILIALIAPLLMAPGQDPCPTCRVVASFYAALDAKDVDKAMAYIAEEAVLWRDNVAYRGKAEIKEHLKREIVTYSYQVDNIAANQEGISYAWKLVSDREVWAGTDTAIVDEKGQILKSKLTIP